MKKLFEILKKVLQRKRRDRRDHTSEELDWPFFLFVLSFTTIFICSSSFAIERPEIYLFSKYGTVENAKANENIEYNERYHVFGVGGKFEFIKNLIFDVKAGIGKAKTNIDTFYKTSILGKEHVFEKRFNHRTGMYLFEIESKYYLNKDLSLSVSADEVKNGLKRNSIMFKIAYQF